MSILGKHEDEPTPERDEPRYSAPSPDETNDFGLRGPAIMLQVGHQFIPCIEVGDEYPYWDRLGRVTLINRDDAYVVLTFESVFYRAENDRSGGTAVYRCTDDMRGTVTKVELTKDEVAAKLEEKARGR